VKERLQNLLENKKFHYLCVFFISLLVAIPLIGLKIRYTHDGALHILRLMGTKLSLNYTAFPHLVIPFFCSNFGYSINAFYAPMATYLPYLFTYLPILYSDALKIFSYCTILFSGITMYHCAYEITQKRKIALLASLFYMLAPYRSEDIYTRFALAEFTTFVFIPIIFQGLHNLLEGDKTKHWYIAIGATGLVLTHTITTFYVALFCLVYVICHWSRKAWKDTFPKLIWNTIFILAMTAFFWVVLLEFRNFTQYTFFDQELMGTNQKAVVNQAIQWEELLLDKNGNIRDISYRLGKFTIVLLILTILAFRELRKDKTYVIFAGFTLMSLFMCMKMFPWKEMPNIFWQIQFPWRMLGEFVFFSSILIAQNCGWIWNSLKREKRGTGVFVVICVILLLSQYQGGLKRYATLRNLDEKEDKVYEEAIAQNLSFSIFCINRDYLPYQTMKHPEEIDTKPDAVSVIKGEANIQEEEKRGTDLSCQLENVKKGTKLEIPYFYYPGYVVTLQNEKEEIILPQEESEYGMIAVTIPEDMETAKITVRYQGTGLEKASYGFSLLSYFVFLAMIVREKKREKQGETT